MPSYVKNVHVKADKCPEDPAMVYFRKDADFTLSLREKESDFFVISNEKGAFSASQHSIKFLNKIKSGKARVRYGILNIKYS